VCVGVGYLPGRSPKSLFSEALVDTHLTLKLIGLRDLSQYFITDLLKHHKLQMLSVSLEVDTHVHA